MRLGIVSDVHANAPALSAVLAELKDVDRLLHAGDIVGYHPFPTETIRIFIEKEIISIQGNHDRAVCADSTEYFREQFASHAADAIEWTQTQLDSDSIGYLRSLPEERELAIGGKIVRLVHGAPDDPDRYVYPDDITPDLTGHEDILVLGHTHYQFCVRFTDSIVLNPGSVGQPRDDSSGAAYAIVDTDTDEIRLGRVEYPIEQVTAAVTETELPSQVAEKLRQN